MRFRIGFETEEVSIENNNRSSRGPVVIGGPVQISDEELLVIIILAMRNELESTSSDQLKKDMLDYYINKIREYERKVK